MNYHNKNSTNLTSQISVENKKSSQQCHKQHAVTEEMMMNSIQGEASMHQP